MIYEIKLFSESFYILTSVFDEYLKDKTWKMVVFKIITV